MSNTKRVDMTFFLGFDQNNDLVLTKRGTLMRKTVITSLDQLRRLVGNASLFCSSSVDFPEDSTSNQDIIELCRFIRRS